MYAKVKDQEVRVESHHEESLRRGLNTHTSREKREKNDLPSRSLYTTQRKAFKIVGSRAL